MLSISCEGVAEGLRSLPGSAADAKAAFRAAERAMAAALRIHRRVRDLLDVAPEVDMGVSDVEATTSRVAGQVSLNLGSYGSPVAEQHCGVCSN